MAEMIVLPNDRALIEAVAAGQAGAFELLVRRYQRICWVIAYRVSQNPNDAADICQEAFLRVHRYLGQFRGDSSLGTWIGRIAYTTAYTYITKQRHSIFTELDEGRLSTAINMVESRQNVEEDYEQEQVVAIVRASIATLPTSQRVALTLYHLEERSLNDIAIIMSLPINTVKSHLIRGRAKLKSVVESKFRKSYETV